MKNFWQPSIDYWIIKESDSPFPSTASSPMNGNDSSRQSHLFGANLMGNGDPVKSEEQEDKHDALQQDYKGIKSFSKLKEQINQILEDVYNLSKIDKDHKDNTTNPYDNILQTLQSPNLMTMLKMASDEVKKRNITSF